MNRNSHLPGVAPAAMGWQFIWYCVCQGVDIFEKDFLLLPIHDHLHWSLVIICHAGTPPEEESCTPWILHLDSMSCESRPHLNLRLSECSSALLARTVWNCEVVRLLLVSNWHGATSQRALYSCSWPPHPKGQEGAAGVPHPGVGLQGLESPLLLELFCGYPTLTTHNPVWY